MTSKSLNGWLVGVENKYLKTVSDVTGLPSKTYLPGYDTIVISGVKL